MKLHLDRENYYVILAFLVISVISGFLMDLFSGQALLTIHDATFYLPGPVLLLGGIFIYLARDKYGGTIARNLEVSGLALGILGVTWVAWAGFFAAGFPAWGVTPAFWTAFLGTLITLMFLVAAYGFYLFYKLGEQVERGESA